jgi:hypothetical protein
MTSIEWLIEELDELIPYGGITTSQLFDDVLAKAKEMHKQEIINAYFQCGKDNFDHIKVINKSATDYYQETFVSKGSSETLKDYHIVEANEMVELPKQYIDKLGNEDVPKLGYCEISDEEIYKGIWDYCKIPHDRLLAEVNAMIDGAKWYREQLKQRNG